LCIEIVLDLGRKAKEVFTLRRQLLDATNFQSTNSTCGFTASGEKKNLERPQAKALNAKNVILSRSSNNPPKCPLQIRKVPLNAKTLFPS
jgi:hypothetical protein